ncbi:MAG TPA: dTMP kinase [Elusimicrobia bacterium]|jgi:dTMP kinase|nr:dTMP kinase [Elusimicrobiota bacterium]
MKKGLFITFEGVDGSGKSTHSKLLAEYLRKKGYNVVHTREPGGVSIAESLREILLHPKNKISSDTELFLYLAARAQHVAELIRPALKENISKPVIVICERFSDATFAYQGYGRRFDLKLLKKLDTLARQGIKPDLTLLFDLPRPFRRGAEKITGKILSSSLLTQRKGRGLPIKKWECDRLENEPLSFHQRVRRGYLRLAKQEPKRFRVVKVKGSIEETQKEVRKIIDEFLTHTWARKSN